MSSKKNNGSVLDFIRNTLDDLKDISQVQSIVIGSTSGIVTGYFLNKVGRLAAFSVGSSVIVLQIAQHLGYIEVRLGKKPSSIDEIKKKAIKAAEELTNSKIEEKTKVEKVVIQVKSFLQNNVTFGISYIGGTLIGFSL